MDQPIRRITPAVTKPMSPPAGEEKERLASIVARCVVE